MRHTVTLRNQLKALQFALVIVLAMGVFMLYFSYSDPTFPIEFFVWVFGIELLPVLYLHLEYLLINRTCSVRLNTDLAVLRLNTNNEDLSLNFGQIAKIVLYLPPSAYRGVILRKMQFFPFESYGYAVVYSKDGDKFIITSLMVPSLIDEFEKIKGVPLDKRTLLFASPSFETLIQWFNKDGL